MLTVFTNCRQVNRTLIFWESGKKDVPVGPLSFFSKSNWGDHMERCDGRDVAIKTTSNLIKIVKKLNNIQWDKIYNTASAPAKHKKAMLTNVIEIPDSSDSDFDIEDDDDDLKLPGSRSNSPQTMSVTSRWIEMAGKLLAAVAGAAYILFVRCRLLLIFVFYLLSSSFVPLFSCD